MCLLPYITGVTRLSLTCGYWSAPLSHVTTLITCCREVFAQWQLSLCENIHVTVADGSFFLRTFSFSTVYHLTKNIRKTLKDKGKTQAVIFQSCANINAGVSVLAISGMQRGSCFCLMSSPFPVHPPPPRLHGSSSSWAQPHHSRSLRGG